MHFELRSASVNYDGIPALDNISCSLSNTSLTIITGPSGAGKTTFLRLLYADILPNKGAAFVNGQESTSLSPKQQRHLLRKIGIIFQDSVFIETCTVAENIQYPLIINNIKRENISHAVLTVMSSLEISHLRDKFPRQLSGGEKRMIALARSIVHKPQAIIADEPTGNLDDHTALKVVSTLKRFADDGVTVILSTHSNELLSYFSHAETLHLAEGKIARHKTGGVKFYKL